MVAKLPNTTERRILKFADARMMIQKRIPNTVPRFVKRMMETTAL